MTYWFILNGEQSGPYTLEEASRVPFVATTPAWKTGMEQWSTAALIPELREIINQRFQENGHPEEVVAETVVVEAPETGYPRIQEPVQEIRQTGRMNGFTGGNEEKRPSTYLVWSILSTILCCFPLGVAAIIFSVKAGRKADSGDYEGARKSAEIAQWMIILSITLGLVWSPFQGLLSSL